jgi:hypothetical protein
MKSLSLALFTALLSLPATAQVVVQASSVVLQPQIGRDAVGYTQCGVRAVVLDVKPKIVDTYDFSIMFRLGLLAGMVKAGKYETSSSDFLKQKLALNAVMPAPVTFWIAKESEGKALMPTKIIPADTPGFILAGTDMLQAWSTVIAVIQGERMQFATRYKKQGNDTVVSFAGSMPEQELQPLMACMQGLAQRMRDEAPPKANNKPR